MKAAREVHKKVVRNVAHEMVSKLTVEQACMYLDRYCKNDQERMEILSAIWKEYLYRAEMRAK